MRRIDAKIRIYTDKEKRGWVEIKRYIYIERGGESGRYIERYK